MRNEIAEMFGCYFIGVVKSPARSR